MKNHHSNYQIWFILALTFAALSLKAQDQTPSPLVHSFEEHTKMKSETTYRFDWIPIGPSLNGARVEAVQADPSNPGTIYVAFGSGGLWKSINNGMTWKPTFENMPSLGIGDIALAPSNPEIIYVGTGESLKKARNFTMPGVGIYRSDDGGESWRHIGLNDCWHIGEITVHPQNPDIVLVAAQGHFWSSNSNRGIFRTEDGGQSWQHVLFIDEKTGANDIVFSPADPNIAYATMWENYPEVNGAKSGIYKSNDLGKTWTKTVNGIPIDDNTGRIGIAASYQNPNKAYAFIDQRNRGMKRGAGEIYKTTDGGDNWLKTHEGDIKSLSVIGWYFMDTYVNPQNDEEIYGLGVRLIHSEDGGKTFNYIGGQINHLSPSPAQTLHLDHCEMWINPLNPSELLLGNDGGLYHSYDKGDSWLHLNNIPTGEFYDIEIDKQEPYTIYGGVQDDATVFGPSKEWNPKFNDPWQYLWIDAWSGGDGCITLVDPNDSNTLYFSMQNGAARRLDIRSKRSVSIRPNAQNGGSNALKYNFITPYQLSPHNSERVYMAGNHLLRSDNRGDKWKIISPNFIEQRNHPETETAAGAFAESFLEEGLLFVGTDRGTLWCSKNGGTDWDNITGDFPPNYIRSICPSRHKKERLYIQLTGLNYDDLGAYLYVSEDYGDTWNSIKSNLPNHPINFILEDPEHENLLFAGTYRGVYFSKNRGKSWSYFGTNLPDVSIADIVIEEKTKDMVIATHGRGIYKTNLQPIYDLLAQNIQSNHLFDLPKATAPLVRDTHRDIDEQSVQKISITFWLEKVERVSLNVLNQKDSSLFHKTLDGREGFNQFRWDMVTNEEDSDSPYFIHYKRYLEAGKYWLSFENSEGVLKKRLIVQERNQPK